MTHFRLALFLLLIPFAGCVADSPSSSEHSSVFAGGECPAPDHPGVDYTSTTPGDCALADIACPDGWQAFENECGCGCVLQEAPTTCCEPEGPGIDYLSHNPDQCAVADFTCPENWEAFSDDCGCGCRAPEEPANCCAADEQPGVDCFDMTTEADCLDALGCGWQPTDDGGACVPGADEGYLCCADGQWHPNWSDGDPAACDAYGGVGPVCQ